MVSPVSQRKRQALHVDPTANIMRKTKATRVVVAAVKVPAMPVVAAVPSNPAAATDSEWMMKPLQANKEEERNPKAVTQGEPCNLEGGGRGPRESQRP